MNLGKFLIKELHHYGAKHIFGIPGDYTLNLIAEIEDSHQIEYVGVSREDSAGLAADAYARVTGCGVCCVTYSVGGMNAMNAVSGAFAERSPVVLLTGKPSKEDLQDNPNKHHTIDTDHTQKDIFEHVTVAAISLDSSDMFTNMLRIHSALKTMVTESRPIYIESSNKDIARIISPEILERFRTSFEDDFASSKSLNAPSPSGIETFWKEESSPRSGRDNDRLSNAKNPVLILGHEIFRHSLEYRLLDFAEKLNIPVFTTILGKGTIDEGSHVAMGCLSNLMSPEGTIAAVTASDCIITLGLTITDVDGFKFSPSISLSMNDKIWFDNFTFPELIFEFCRYYSALLKPQSNEILREWYKVVGKDDGGSWMSNWPGTAVWTGSDNFLTLNHVFNTLDEHLEEDHIVISDIGESLFGMIPVPVAHGQFLSMGYYTSMGFSMPAAVGLGFAKPKKRSIVIVGDGAFQMTGSEFSSHIAYNLNTVVIILNNKGYSTERAIMEGRFNDIHNWEYEKITDLMGGGIGKSITTAEEFTRDLRMAFNDESQSYVLNVHIDPADRSEIMRNMAEKMCQKAL